MTATNEGETLPAGGDGQDAAAERRLAPEDAWPSKAHSLVKLAVAAGKLVPGPCQWIVVVVADARTTDRGGHSEMGICGVEPTLAHHDDYTRPLAVRWLCRPHHALAHRNVNHVAPTPSRATLLVANRFVEQMTAITHPVVVVRDVRGERVALGLWLPSAFIDVEDR